MGAVGAVLPIGLAVSLSPVPIIALVLLLFTPRARRDGIAFVLGWILGVGGAAGVLVILGSAGLGDPGQPSTWVAVVKVVLGAGLVGLAGLQWSRRRKRAERVATLPTWMHALDRFGPVRALGLALLFSVVNPESLLLIVSAAAVIVQAATTPTQEAVAFVVFVVVGTLGPTIPLAIFLFLGERAHPLLVELRRWLGTNNTAILAVLLLVIGTALLGGGISELPA